MFDPIVPAASSSALEPNFVASINSHATGFKNCELFNLMSDRFSTFLSTHEVNNLRQLNAIDYCQVLTEMSRHDTVRGSTNNDVLRGSGQSDSLFGLAGDDILWGRTGNDTLNGGIGNDQLVGGKGNDVLTDFDGGDILTGGKGMDTFAISGWGTPDQPTTITDFEIGRDTIKMNRLGATFDELTIQTRDKEALISDRGITLAVLFGIDGDQLTADNFVFGDSELADQLQVALDSSLKESGAPGATQAVITSEGFIWEGAAGVSDLTTNTATQPSDIFGINSIAKTFTAATVLKLQESEKLSLDDTLSQWLPEVAQNIPNGESITIRQILNGSSGIPNDSSGVSSDILNDNSLNTSDDDPTGGLINLYFDYLNGSTNDLSPEASVASVYGVPRFSGRASSDIWTYPDIGNNIAGLIVEKAAGSSFSKVLREQILNPLGLNHTFFVGDEQVVGNVAHAYEDVIANGRFGQDGIFENYTGFLLATSFADGWANGAIYSTAQDVARFSSALFNGELLGPDSVKELTTFVDEGIVYEGSQYGLGLANFENFSERVWGKGGGFAGYNSEMRYFPDRNGATAIALTNSLNVANLDLANPSLPARVILDASLPLIRHFR